MPRLAAVIAAAVLVALLARTTPSEAAERPFCTSPSTTDRIQPPPGIYSRCSTRRRHRDLLVVGRGVDRYPAPVADAYAYARGHTIQNHSFSHVRLTNLSDGEIVREIRSNGDVIRSITGETPKCVRPPWGQTDRRVEGVIDSLGKSQELSDVSADDWSRPRRRRVPLADGRSVLDAALPMGVVRVPSRQLARPRPGAPAVRERWSDVGWWGSERSGGCHRGRWRSV